MSILDWIDIGKVSAERDDHLSHYFYDNGVLQNVINSPTSFLILGRKGAGKTAVFKYLQENYQNYIKENDILVALSFEDYNWRVHATLETPEAAESLAYKQSWRFVLLVEAIKAIEANSAKGAFPLPRKIQHAKKLLEKLFSSPVPSIGQIIGKKILSLSRLKLPTGSLDLETGNLDEVSVSTGEIEFNEVQESKDLKSVLSNNIERLIELLDTAISDSLPLPVSVFICFDRIDEAWDPVSVDLSKKVIAGLIGAADSITQKYSGAIRPIIFLREDIFEVLPINDSNKLREDCGSLLKWDRTALESVALKRINYFAQQNEIGIITSIDDLFDKKEMRQRTRPFNYILKRSMMRPRDVICFLKKTIDSMKEKHSDPFLDLDLPPTKIEADLIYEAEPSYSEWLKQEIVDEWAVQYPRIKNLLDVIQNLGSTNLSSDAFEAQLQAELPSLGNSECYESIRFLFENSILGFKTGNSSIWKYKCVYPSQGFVRMEEYRIHDGLVRCLNLKEPRDGQV